MIGETVKTFPLGVDEDRWKSNTITVREVAMLAFVNAITDKPEWWRKVDDEEIVAKWKTEIATFVEKGASPFQNGFTDVMFDFCMKELRDKAAIYKATANNGSVGGIVSVLDTAAAVFKADGRVPPSVVDALRAAASKFEDVPGDEKDWHPGSDDKVLDLVHPSLWPLVYGTSRQVAHDIPVNEALQYIGAGEIVPVPTVSDLGLLAGIRDRQRLWSTKFQWLPAEVSFGANGKGLAEITSYINNAHPEENKDLYPVIAQLIDLSLPMLTAAYDRAMSWSAEYIPQEIYPERKRIQCDDSNRLCTTKDHCGRYCDSYSMPEAEIPEGMEHDSEEYYEAVREWYSATHPVEQPEPDEYEFAGVKSYQTEGPWFPTALRRPVGALTDEEKAAEKSERDRQAAEYHQHRVVQDAKEEEEREADATAAKKAADEAKVAAREAAAKEEGKDHRLQVIVKLANIHLTPEKPRYDGGSWHFEGQFNEHICATALFYYDCENVTESRLAFRTMSDAEGYNEGEFQYDQGDHEPFEMLYGMNPSMDQDLTAQKVGDVVTKEGRLLVFPNVYQHQVQPFELQDKTKPGHRKIVALFLVDPQVRVPSTATVPPQQLHWREASVVDSRLPPEISAIVYEHVKVPFGLDEAKKLRGELIEERKAIDSNVDGILEELGWNFCEH